MLMMHNGDGSPTLGCTCVQSDTIQTRFEAFDKENPKLWEYIKRYALEVKRRGLIHYGIAAIIERARWELNVTISVLDGEDFKINNNYRSRYARKLMAEVPDLVGFFRVRDLRRI
jgi:hypothetical protein